MTARPPLERNRIAQSAIENSSGRVITTALQQQAAPVIRGGLLLCVHIIRTKTETEGNYSAPCFSINSGHVP